LEGKFESWKKIKRGNSEVLSCKYILGDHLKILKTSLKNFESPNSDFFRFSPFCILIYIYISLSLTHTSHGLQNELREKKSRVKGKTERGKKGRK
jgi:hypothetical protein